LLLDKPLVKAPAAVHVGFDNLTNDLPLHPVFVRSSIGRRGTFQERAAERIAPGGFVCATARDGQAEGTSANVEVIDPMATGHFR